MAIQSADHYQKTEEHDEQVAHQHKQARRAMSRTHEKRTHQVHRAQGDSQQTIYHGTDAVKSNGAYYGNKERSREIPIRPVTQALVERTTMFTAPSTRSNGDQTVVGLLIISASKSECGDDQARSIQHRRDHAFTQEETS